MTILLPTLPVALAAFRVWLTVRIVNRRERWAMVIFVALVAVAAYAAIFGNMLDIAPDFGDE